MDTHSIDGPQKLAELVTDNIGKRGELMKALVPNKTEFFRDPGVWRYLEVELPKIISEKGSIKILDLGCSSGEELLTMSILCNDLNIQNKVELVGTERYQLKLDEVSKGEFPVKELESCENNIGRFRQGASFSAYIQEVGDVFKYAVGNCVTQEDAIELQNKVRQTEFNDAFVVAFYKGERVSVKKAKELIAEGKQ